MSEPDSPSTEATEHDGPAPTVGARLRRLREKKNLTRGQVSEETHISRTNLAAIEDEHFEKLPADTFTRGLITIYGDFLGINGASAAKLFLKERDHNQPRSKRPLLGRQTPSLNPKKLAEPAHVSSATIATILLLLIIVSASSFCVYTGWNPFSYFLRDIPSVVAPLSKTIDREPVKKATTTPSPADEPTKPAADEQQKTTQPYTLTAVFSRNTGIDVIIDGGEAVHLQGVEGQKLQWQADTSMRLLFEQPESAAITVNEAAIAFPTRKQDGKLTLTIPDELPRP